MNHQFPNLMYEFIAANTADRDDENVYVIIVNPFITQNHFAWKFRQSGRQAEQLAVAPKFPSFSTFRYYTHQALNAKH
jgi:hypothetical protein